MAARKLGEMLFEHGLVTRGQLDDALQSQMIYGGRLGTNLIELGHLSETELARFLSSQLGLPSVSPDEFEGVSKETLKVLSADMAAKHLVFPLALSGRKLRLAMVDPTDLSAVDEIRFHAGVTVQPVVAPEVVVRYALEKHYEVPRPSRYLRLDRDTEEQMMQAHRAAVGPEPRPPDRPRAQRPADTDPGIRLVEPVAEPGFDVEAIAAELVVATRHMQVVEIFRDALAHDFARVAVFGVQKAMAVGWMHAGLRPTEEEFRRLSFVLEDTLTITELVHASAPCVGEVGSSPLEKWLVGVIGAQAGTPLLFAPVSIGDAPTFFAICDGSRSGSLSRTVAKCTRLARKTAAALQMLTFRQQILQG